MGYDVLDSLVCRGAGVLGSTQFGEARRPFAFTIGTLNRPPPRASRTGRFLACALDDTSDENSYAACICQSRAGQSLEAGPGSLREMGV